MHHPQKESEMKRTAPLLTLLAGLGVGAVLFVANTVVSARDEGPPDPAPAAQAAATTAAPAAPTAAPTVAATTAPPAEKVSATWAGDVDGGKASIAIAAKNGVAIAYVCDGNRVEGWLQGTAADGKLELAGKNAKLSGTFGNGRAEGTVTVGRWTWTFDVAAVKKPSGLYRATANVRNAEVTGGWIVLGGRQVGSVTSVEGTQSAPRLPLPSLTTTWDGVPLVAEPLS
jgi:serine/threonine-protein kinase